MIPIVPYIPGEKDFNQRPKGPLIIALSIGVITLLTIVGVYVFLRV